jgi:hypothetical protein
MSNRNLRELSHVELRKRRSIRPFASLGKDSTGGTDRSARMARRFAYQMGYGLPFAPFNASVSADFTRTN